MQKQLSEHLGLKSEVHENGTHHLMKEMNVEHLVSELEEKMPSA
jgi:hypothetical protein